MDGRCEVWMGGGVDGRRCEVWMEGGVRCGWKEV